MCSLIALIWPANSLLILHVPPGLTSGPDGCFCWLRWGAGGDDAISSGLEVWARRAFCFHSPRIVFLARRAPPASAWCLPHFASLVYKTMAFLRLNRLWARLCVRRAEIVLNCDGWRWEVVAFSRPRFRFCALARSKCDAWETLCEWIKSSRDNIKCVPPPTTRIGCCVLCRYMRAVWIENEDENLSWVHNTRIKYRTHKFTSTTQKLTFMFLDGIA